MARTMASIFTLVCTALLLLAPLSVGAVELNTNIMTGGDFEKAGEEMPEKWCASDVLRTPENTAVITNSCYHWDNTSYVRRVSRESGSCVQISPLSGVYKHLLYAPLYVEPGATYEISMELKAPQTAKAYLKVEYYKTTDRSFSDFMTTGIPTTNDQWGTVTMRFTPSAVTKPNKVTLLFRLGGTDSILIDNIECRKVINAPAAIMDTDEKFYYSDAELGTARLKPTGLVALETGTSATLALTDENGTAVTGVSPATVDFVGADAVYTYPLSVLSLGTEYRVTYTIQKGGETLQSGYETIYRYNRPSMITQDGKITWNGQPFLPVMGYHVSVNNIEDYNYCRMAGVNVVQLFLGTNNPTSIRQRLDLLQSYGLLAFVALYGGGTDVAAVVAVASTHPAVFGYMLMDEPQNNGTPFSTLETLYKTIRDNDSVHPTYIVESMAREDTLRLSAKYADIFAIDPYPSGAHPVETYIAESVKKAIAAVEDNKPVMCINQCFPRGIEPTGEQVRHMSYQALLAGAKGIGYYDMRDSQGYDNGNKLHIWQRPCWDTILRFAEMELPIVKNAFASGLYTEIAAQTDETSNVWYRSYQDGEISRCILQNRETTENTVTVPIFGGSFAEQISGVPGKIFTLEGNALTVTLAGGETLLVQVSDAAQEGVTFSEKTEGEYRVITATCNVSASRDCSPTLLLAAYSPDATAEKELLYFEKSGRISLRTGEQTTLYLTIEVPASTMYNIKAFTWDMPTIRPLSDAKSFVCGEENG